MRKLALPIMMLAGIMLPVTAYADPTISPPPSPPHVYRTVMPDGTYIQCVDYGNGPWCSPSN